MFGMLIRAFAWRLFFPVFALMAPAAASAAPETLQLTSFTESLSPSVKVSGDPRVGLLVGDLTASIEPVRLYFDVSGATPEKYRHLCAKITSKDGRYLAKLEAGLPAGSRSEAQVVATTRFAPDLKHLVAGELAVMAWVSADDCKKKPAAYIPSSWEQTSPTMPMKILINTGRHLRTSAVPVMKGSKGTAIPCDRAGGDVLVGFDTICDLTKAGPATYDAVLIRRQDIDPLPELTIPLATR